MRGFCAVVALIACAALSGEAEAEGVQLGVTAGVGVGAIGTKFWRIRAIQSMNGQEWALSHLSFYDSTAADAKPLAIPDVECTGHEEAQGKKPPTACMLASSRKLVKKEDPNPNDKDKTAANLEPDTPHPTADAFKAGDDTFWMSNTNQKDEWIGVQFENPTDVLEVKMKVTSIGNSPPAFVVEKSFDGEEWARATEVLNCKEWAEKIESFAWKPMDAEPTSVFSIRSQKDPSLCIGAKPIPDPEEPELVAPKPIDFKTPLEVQRCDDTKNTQFWYMNKETNRLVNAAGKEYIAHMDKPEAGAAMSIGECNKDCASLTEIKSDIFAYSPGSAGGLLHVKDEGKTNLVVAMPEGSDKKIAKGTVTVAKCGNDKTKSANVANCKDLTNAQFELSPMFLIEKNKRAINCSPYSHSHAKPVPCKTQLEAQALCAKDKKCMAYNWVDSSYSGAEKDLVWLCHEIHDVHLKTEKDPLDGWELGIRAGFSEDLIEEVRALKTRATSAEF